MCGGVWRLTCDYVAKTLWTRENYAWQFSLVHRVFRCVVPWVCPWKVDQLIVPKPRNASIGNAVSPLERSVHGQAPTGALLAGGGVTTCASGPS